MSRKLIYIYPNLSSFVQKDKTIFEKQFQVTTFQFGIGDKWITPWYLFKEFWFLLFKIPASDIVIIQFGGYHSFIPVMLSGLFHKPSAIVMGGTDCVSFPSIGYGNLRKPLLRWFTLKSFRCASLLVPASESLVEYNYTYQDNDYPKQGYKYFDPGNTTPYRVISNGISLSNFKFKEGISRKKNAFLTVCTNLDSRNFHLKGIDLFVSAAKRFPAYNFILIGKLSGGFMIEELPNLSHIQSVKHDNLPELMSSCSFYCQLSISEGFGVALIEAMACGCVPIVSKVGILDQIVGDSGFILEKPDNGLLASIIEKAVNSDVKELSGKARVRVVNSFSDEKRSTQLLSALNNLVLGTES